MKKILKKLFSTKYFGFISNIRSYAHCHHEERSDVVIFNDILIRMNQEHITPELLEKAEIQRQKGNLLQAYTTAVQTLGISDTFEFTLPDRQDIQTIKLIAGMARISVDTAKTLGNVSTTPQEAADWYMNAANIIQAVYRQADVLSLLKNETTDTNNHPYSYTAEMQRDCAKTVLAIASLAPQEEQKKWIQKAEAYYNNAYETADPASSLLHIIDIENILLKPLQQSDEAKLTSAIDAIYQSCKETNPHRAASVCACILAKETIPQHIVSYVQDLYNDCTALHPEWGDMITKEKEKNQNIQKRGVLNTISDYDFNL